MRALFYRTFCPYEARRASLWYLSAGLRYTTRSGDGTLLCPPQLPGAPHALATHDLIGINSSIFVRLAFRGISCDVQGDGWLSDGNQQGKSTDQPTALHHVVHGSGLGRW